MLKLKKESSSLKAKSLLPLGLLLATALALNACGAQPSDTGPAEPAVPAEEVPAPAPGVTEEPAPAPAVTEEPAAPDY